MRQMISNILIFSVIPEESFEEQSDPEEILNHNDNNEEERLELKILVSKFLHYSFSSLTK